MGRNPFIRKHANLYIDDHVIRYLELHNKNPLTVKRIAEFRLTHGIIQEGKIVDSEALLKIMKRLAKDWNLHKRRIQFIVPDALVVIRKIELPITIAEKELHNYLHYEIGTSIHLPFDEPVFDTHLMMETDEYKEILLFAVPKAAIDNYIDIFQSVKLKPIVADLSALSLYRLYHHQKDDEKEQKSEHILLMQAGFQSVSTTVFHNHLPLFMRQFSIESISQEEESVMLDRYLETEQIQEITAEIDRIINFYRYTLHQGNVQVTKIIVTGELTNFSPIQQQMEEALDIPVSIFIDDSIRIFRKSKKREGISLPPSYYPVLGLALKEV